MEGRIGISQPRQVEKAQRDEEIDVVRLENQENKGKKDHKAWTDRPGVQISSQGPKGAKECASIGGMWSHV